MRSRINTSWASRNEPTEQAAGGNALKFYTSLRVEMKKGAAIKEKRVDPNGGLKEVDVIVGHVHHARAFKNKVAIPNRETDLYIKFDQLNNIYGIDNLSTVIEVAKSKGLIDVSGSTLIYQGTDPAVAPVKARGHEEFWKYLQTNTAVYKEVRSRAGL